MKVLILEDDPFLQIDLADIVGGLDHEVIGPFANAQAAMRACEATLPDTAFLDFNLGDENHTSSGVADFLVANHVPFAFVTGYDRSRLPDRFNDIQLVEKPFDPQEIRTLLESLSAGER